MNIHQQIQSQRTAVDQAAQAAEAALASWDAAIERRDPNIAEVRGAFDAAEAAHRREQRKLDQLVARRDLPVEPILDDEPTTRSGSSRITVTGEPLIYERANPEGPSYFQDLITSRSNPAAQERLDRHARQFAEARALNSTDTTGGDYVPPIWLAESVALARPGRPIADTLTRLPLPPGGDQLNIPKVNTGATVAVQTDGGSVSSTDIATTSVAAAVQTIAGQQDLSRQLFERSVPGIDQVISDDLTRAYAAKLDSLVITGTVTNAKGLNQLSGTNSITYTAATPTAAGLYSKVADAIQQVHTGRNLPPTVIAMHPRRWAWLLAQSDSSNRPLVVPATNGAFNAQGVLEQVAAENRVGTLQGIPVVVDSQIPTTQGAGTNEDQVFVYRAEDLYLWESDFPKIRVFEDVLSGTLQVRIQLYNYAAWALGRYPASISKLGGTGCAAPVF